MMHYICSFVCLFIHSFGNSSVPSISSCWTTIQNSYKNTKDVLYSNGNNDDNNNNTLSHSGCSSHDNNDGKINWSSGAGRSRRSNISNKSWTTLSSATLTTTLNIFFWLGYCLVAAVVSIIYSLLLLSLLFPSFCYCYHYYQSFHSLDHLFFFSLLLSWSGRLKRHLLFIAVLGDIAVNFGSVFSVSL